MLELIHLETEAAPALAFISETWDRLRANARHGHFDRFSSWRSLAAHSPDGHLDDTDHSNPYILYLPNDFITPGGRFMVQFYWDSYFIILGLLRDSAVDLARGIVENCWYLIQQHGMVIANRKRWAAGSQLPFLSQMVSAIYNVTEDKSWLAASLPFVEAEYRGYWLDSDHLLDNGLSRYHAPSCYPADSIAAITMDHEATWDLSPRFELEDVLVLAPVDLNCNLYAYENDLSHFHAELGHRESAEYWRACSQTRARSINRLMWDNESGLYYDYNVRSQQQKPVKSLATFFPLFHGIATEAQAAKVIQNLNLFEAAHGLVACDQTYGYLDRQWNYPVGWAPLHWIAYNGLKRFGHKDDAVRIALKWLNLNHSVWRKTGAFFEKYDVEVGSHEVLTDRYRNQEGFGWTNAVFSCLVEDLVRPQERKRVSE